MDTFTKIVIFIFKTIFNQKKVIIITRYEVTENDNQNKIYASFPSEYGARTLKEIIKLFENIEIQRKEQNEK